MTLRLPSARLTPRFAAFCLLALAFVLLAGTASAITAPQPNWSGLKPQQQEALKPLAGEWDKIDDFRRKKWLGVADKYATMKPDQQKRLHARMAEWARMTPEQRRSARENYKQAKALPPEQKKAEWQQYQTLPENQKKQLAAAADAKKPVKQKQQRRAQESEKKAAQIAKPRTAKATASPSPIVPATAEGPGSVAGAPAAAPAAPR